jgi:hypothetical protein
VLPSNLPKPNRNFPTRVYHHSMSSRLPTIAALLVLGACSSVPPRYTKLPKIHKGFGYVILRSEDSWFDLEVYLKRWRFLDDLNPGRDLVANLFVRAAVRLAMERSLEIETLPREKVVVRSYRNWLGVNEHIASARVVHRGISRSNAYHVRVGTTDSARTYLVLGVNIIRKGKTWELRKARRLDTYGNPGAESLVIVDGDTVELSPVKER